MGEFDPDNGDILDDPIMPFNSCKTIASLPFPPKPLVSYPNLPFEIYRHIVLYIADRATLLLLTRVSRAWCYEADRLLFSIFRITRDNRQALIKECKRLLGFPRHVNNVRDLTVRLSSDFRCDGSTFYDDLDACAFRFLASLLQNVQNLQSLTIGESGTLPKWVLHSLHPNTSRFLRKIVWEPRDIPSDFVSFLEEVPELTWLEMPNSRDGDTTAICDALEDGDKGILTKLDTFRGWDALARAIVKRRGRGLRRLEFTTAKRVRCVKWDEFFEVFESAYKSGNKIAQNDAPGISTVYMSALDDCQYLTLEVMRRLVAHWDSFMFLGRCWIDADDTTEWLHLLSALPHLIGIEIRGFDNTVRRKPLAQRALLRKVRAVCPALKRGRFNHFNTLFDWVLIPAEKGKARAIEEKSDGDETGDEDDAGKVDKVKEEGLSDDEGDGTMWKIIDSVGLAEENDLWREF